MDVQDALELLGPSFTHPAVRAYAVGRLQQAPDEDLLLYLLQLVQALKYENYDSSDIVFALERDRKESQPAPIVEDINQQLSLAEKEFLENSTSTGRTSPTGNLSDVASKGHSSSDASLASNLSAIVGAMSSDLNKSISKAIDTDLNTERPDLASFLIHRACENTTLANYFYW